MVGTRFSTASDTTRIWTNRAVRFLERDLRHGRKVCEKWWVVPLPEIVAEDLELHEASRREVDSQDGLTLFVEQALAHLTVAEGKVFRVLVSDPGKKAVDIAGLLGISEPAVSQHRKNIRTKLIQAGLNQSA